MSDPQYIAPTLNGAVVDEATLDALSKLQNGFTSLQTIKDENNNRIGWNSLAPIDMGAYAAFAASRALAALVAYANAFQWALATGGYTTTIGGKSVTLATSTEALSLMGNAVVRQGQPNPPATIVWQLGPTSFAQFAAADFVAAAIKAADFVQSTFNALPAVLSAITKGSITATAQVDAASWPAAQG